ncbi:unnamed protein product [Pleuronectes platessa]|uniref:Uncharacterized protein n=1 Tax=Pleuronectes platessa TaxID=8262 RepID=A0A9N7UPP8_PLEPL|nr:unnamed protein product [Pleuronectes platessa]
MWLRDGTRPNDGRKCPHLHTSSKQEDERFPSTCPPSSWRRIGRGELPTGPQLRSASRPRLPLVILQVTARPPRPVPRWLWPVFAQALKSSSGSDRARSYPLPSMPCCSGSKVSAEKLSAEPGAVLTLIILINQLWLSLALKQISVFSLIPPKLENGWCPDPVSLAPALARHPSLHLPQCRLIPATLSAPRISLTTDLSHPARRANHLSPGPGDLGAQPPPSASPPSPPPRAH